jgi:hypothetical protein
MSVKVHDRHMEVVLEFGHCTCSRCSMLGASVLRCQRSNKLENKDHCLKLAAAPTVPESHAAAMLKEETVTGK